MDARRGRFGALVEWIVAVAFLAGALVLGSGMPRNVRTAASVMPVSAREAIAPVAPAGVPSRSVSVPMLLLAGEQMVRLGDTETTVAARLGSEVESGPPSAERGPAGERVTRYYDTGGRRFVLVFQPADDQALRVAAIYVQ